METVRGVASRSGIHGHIRRQYIKVMRQMNSRQNRWRQTDAGTRGAVLNWRKETLGIIGTPEKSVSCVYEEWRGIYKSVYIYIFGRDGSEGSAGGVGWLSLNSVIMSPRLSGQSNDAAENSHGQYWQPVLKWHNYVCVYSFVFIHWFQCIYRLPSGILKVYSFSTI